MRKVIVKGKEFEFSSPKFDNVDVSKLRVEVSFMNDTRSYSSLCQLNNSDENMDQLHGPYPLLMTRADGSVEVIIEFRSSDDQDYYSR